MTWREEVQGQPEIPSTIQTSIVPAAQNTPEGIRAHIEAQIARRAAILGMEGAVG